MKLGTDISGHSEEWVLVNSGRDQARQLSLVLSENSIEATRKGWCSLNGRICNHSAVCTLIEAENTLELIKSNALLDLNCVLVQVLNVLAVGKDEGLLGIKAKSDDILDVADGVLLDFIKGVLRPEEELFVISDLDDQRHIEGFL